MNDRVKKTLAPFAFGATVALAVFLAGCSDDEKPSPTAPTAPAPAAAEATNFVSAVNDRLEDPEYRKKLDEQAAELDRLQTTCSRVQARMAARERTIRAALKTDDETTIKAALEKDSEYRSLSMRMDDAREAVEDNRKKSRAIVRERILSNTPKQK